MSFQRCVWARPKISISLPTAGPFPQRKPIVWLLSDSDIVKYPASSNGRQVLNKSALRTRCPDIFEGACRGRSTITTNSTRHLSRPPTQHTRQPSIQSPTAAGLKSEGIEFRIAWPPIHGSVWLASQAAPGQSCAEGPQFPTLPSAQRNPKEVALVFSGLAPLLASIGLYAAMADSVSQRTQKIGVRMAVGSTEHRIHRRLVKT